MVNPSGVVIQSEGFRTRVKVHERGMVEPVVSLAPGPDCRELCVEAGSGSRVRFRLQSIPKDAQIQVTLGQGTCADIFFGADAHENTYRVSYRLGRHASLNVWSVLYGCSANVEHEIHFDEEHAFANLTGLALLDERNEVVQRVKAHHTAPHGVSRQFFKSIVSGHAHSSFDSLVWVGRRGVRSDTRQLCKNLILSKEAKAVSKPELKIDTDDVASSHGAATGALDEASLFYLQSRGISLRQARAALLRGFAMETMENFPPIPAKREFEKIIDERIARLVRTEG